MISFETGPMYSANLSASSEENARLTNQTSFTPTTFPYYSEYFRFPEMPQDFSDVTKEEIRIKCRRRCVICGRPLGDLGHCAHILDSAEEGAKMATFAINVGVLEPTYSRSAVANGLLLCASCHFDFCTKNVLILSPPRQVLQFLVDLLKTDNRTPIYQVLDEIRTGAALRSNIPDPTPVLPYVNMVSIVSLAPEKLRGVPLILYYGAKVSQLLGSHWSIVPSLAAPTSPTSVIIHDATADSTPLSSTFHDLTATHSLPNHYWRIPAGMTPILAYLLYHVAHPKPFSKSEEVRLAIQLRILLMQRFIDGGGPGYGSGNLGSLVDGGGNGGEKRKRGRPKKTISPSLPPILSAVSSIRGQTLGVHFHRFSPRDTRQTTATRGTRNRSDGPRTSITSTQHEFLSILPHRHFHPTQSATVTPIIQTMHRRLMRFV